MRKVESKHLRLNGYQHGAELWEHLKHEGKNKKIRFMMVVENFVNKINERNE